MLEDDKVLVPNDVILPLFTKDIGTDDVVDGNRCHQRSADA